MVLPVPASAGAADEDVALPEPRPLALQRRGAIRGGQAPLLRIGAPGSILGLSSLDHVDDTRAFRPSTTPQRSLDILSSAATGISAARIKSIMFDFVDLSHPLG
jgi:hypothetical protein